MVTLVKCLCVALTLNILVLDCDGARILALFPTSSRSHIISFEALTKELAARGHQVTVVSSFPQDKIIPNYTDIAVPLNTSALDYIDMFDIDTLQMMKMLMKVSYEVCEFYLKDPGVQKLVKGDEKFDLVIISMVFSECLYGFLHKYQPHVIGILPMGGAHSMLDVVGNTSPYAYVPNLMHKYSDHMTFKQRVLNTISITIFNAVNNYLIVPKQDAIMRKYFHDLEPIPYVTELLESKISLMLLNTHVSISYPRPYLPNTIEVGGMHIRSPKKLPQDLQKFLDEANDGVIYFSMGSNLKTSKMSEEKRAAFITAFSKVKQRVLWKSDLETLPGVSPNVKLGKWLPQIDILAHPNVKMFITHGGLLSTQESIYYNVPVIGIPIFGDQDLNMHRAQEAGYGLLLEYKNVTGDSVNWAIDTVLHQTSYKETIQKLSLLFRDQPQTPLQQAVYWTEYVLRHNGATHMRSAALDLAWYQYFLLDVIALLALCLAVICLVTYKCLKAVTKCVCTAMCSKKKVVQVKKGKKNK